MIFLAIEETDMHTSLLTAAEAWSVVSVVGHKSSAVEPSEAALVEERLMQIHLQAGDE